MKLTLLLVLFATATLAQDPTPFDFDWRELKSVWESPELLPTLKKIDPSYDATVRGGRIVGGSIAEVGQFPFSVLVVMDEGYWCGGSLLNAYWVLTAANCVAGRRQASIFSFNDLNVGFYWVSSSAKFIIHESYSVIGSNIVNDIALIKTTTAAPNNAYTAYISLPRNEISNTFAGTTATIQGFGRYSDTGGPVSNVQRYVSVPVLTNSQCSGIWPVTSSQLCTNNSGGRGPCKRDNGGGLFAGDVNTHSSARRVIGIVSFGARLCEVGYPSVYTRVTSFIDWIDNKMATN